MGMKKSGQVRRRMDGCLRPLQNFGSFGYFVKKEP
jgi:hypothetical protein